MDLQAMARDISLKLETAGFPRSEAATRQVLNLAEEVGEFVGAYRRWKGMARRKGTFDDVAKELADVVITAYVTAFELRVHLDEEIAAKLEVIYSRGWHEDSSPVAATSTSDWLVSGLRASGIDCVSGATVTGIITGFLGWSNETGMNEYCDLLLESGVEVTVRTDSMAAAREGGAS